MRFSALERRWLGDVLDAILPSGAHPRLTLGARDLPMGRFVDDLLLRAPATVGIGLRLCLWVVTFAPLARLRLRLFGSLPLDERVALLGALEHSRIHLLREVPVLLKTLACLGYCGVPEVQRQVGISPLPHTPPRWMR